MYLLYCLTKVISLHPDVVIEPNTGGFAIPEQELPHLWGLFMKELTIKNGGVFGEDAIALTHDGDIPRERLAEMLNDKLYEYMPEVFDIDPDSDENDDDPFSALFGEEE